MPRFDLAALARRANPGIRRKAITLRDIKPPAMLATDLYRAAYAPIITAWTNALPRIEAAYAQALSELVTDSAADVAQEIDSAASEVNRLRLVLTPELRDWTLKVESFVRGKWRGSVLSATSVDLNTLLGPEDMRATLDQYLQWNTDLIADVSTQIRQRVSGAVYSGLTERRTARDVAREIHEATDLGRKRSQRIASDQLAKLSGSLAEERQREAGIEIVIWRSSHKLNPRPAHAARDGKKYRLSDYTAVDGNETVAPNDWCQRPPYCGCRTSAWIDLSGD